MDTLMSIQTFRQVISRAASLPPPNGWTCQRLWSAST